MFRGLSKIKLFLIAGLLALTVSAGFFNVALATDGKYITRAKLGGEQYNFSRDSGLLDSGGEAGYDIAESTSINSLIGSIILVALSLLGIVFLIYIIYGGYSWMTAHGNQEKAKKAMSIVMASLMGLIITLAAYGVSWFVIDNLWK